MDEIAFDKYDTRGADYHWRENSLNPFTMNPYVRARYKKCLRLLQSKLSLEGKKVLDIGCGDGVLTYEIARKGADSFGIDLSEKAISFAIQKHKKLASPASFFVESCYETHFEDNYFEAVISSDVIEHLQQPERFLREMHRVMKQNGYAVISTPVKFTQTPRDRNHVTEWFPEEFKQVVHGVFPDTDFAFSHPVVWYELLVKNPRNMILISLLTYFHNPFLNSEGWIYPTMQYAICRKS